MDSKFLCKEDCKGLCPDCGKNLNLGPCGCRKKNDPRFAVLEQTFGNNEIKIEPLKTAVIRRCQHGSPKRKSIETET